MFKLFKKLIQCCDHPKYEIIDEKLKREFSCWDGLNHYSTIYISQCKNCGSIKKKEIC